MIQSKSKSELGFHFHFVSFHFTSFRSTSAHLIFISYHFISFHFIFILIFISFSLSFSIWFHMWFHFVSFRLEGCREPCNDSTPEELSGSLGLYFFQFFCKPTAEAMRKQFGSFAEAGIPISQPDRPAGEFLRFRQISAEAKSLRIRIMRKACGRRLGRFGLMFEFPAEAKPLENRI